MMAHLETGKSCAKSCAKTALKFALKTALNTGSEVTDMIPSNVGRAAPDTVRGNLAQYLVASMGARFNRGFHSKWCFYGAFPLNQIFLLLRSWLDRI